MMSQKRKGAGEALPDMSGGEEKSSEQRDQLHLKRFCGPIKATIL